ncbi:hypothetical protein JCM6882_005751 [Rhodosporidiobolus microsporus]
MPRSTPSSSRTSFSSLPRELRAEIARHVRQQDCEDDYPTRERRWRFRNERVRGADLEREIKERFERTGTRTTEELARTMNEVFALLVPRRSGLSALSLVDRESYAVCRPLLWEHVDLRKRTCGALLRFLDDILPRHAQLVRSLRWDHNSTFTKSDLVSNEPDFRTYREEEEIETAEAFDEEEPDMYVAMCVRRLRMPGLIFAEIIRLCPLIHSVAFDPYDPRQNFREWSRWDDWPDCAFLAVLPLADQLRSLEVVDFFDNVDSFDLVVRLLKQVRHLEALRIRPSNGSIRHHRQPEPDRLEIFPPIRRMRKLKLLDLTLCFKGVFDLLPVDCPLERLGLELRDNPEPAAVAAYLSNFSSTLLHLKLYDLPSVSTPIQPVHLPQLTSLQASFDVDCDDGTPSFLNTFSTAPLQILYLRCFPDGQYGALVSLLEHCRSTLERIELFAWGGIFGSGDEPEALGRDTRAKLRTWCRGAGAKYVKVHEWEELEEELGSGDEGTDGEEEDEDE